MHTCRHSYGGAFPSTDENSKTIAAVMKTCCNRAMPTGGNTLFSTFSSLSLSAAVSYSRKRIGNNSEICAICPVWVFVYVCGCECVSVTYIYSVYQIVYNLMDVKFSKTCRYNCSLKLLTTFCKQKKKNK